MSPDQIKITNVVVKREMSTDKSLFKEFSPSYKETFHRNLKFE